MIKIEKAGIFVKYSYLVVSGNTVLIACKQKLQVSSKRGACIKVPKELCIDGAKFVREFPRDDTRRETVSTVCNNINVRQ